MGHSSPGRWAEEEDPAEEMEREEQEGGRRMVLFQMPSEGSAHVIEILIMECGQIHHNADAGTQNDNDGTDQGKQALLPVLLFQHGIPLLLADVWMREVFSRRETFSFYCIFRSFYRACLRTHRKSCPFGDSFSVRKV